MLNNENIDERLKDSPIVRIGDYVSYFDKILCECKIHNYQWSVLVSNILRRQRCPICSKKRRITNEVVDEKIKEHNLPYIRLENVINGSTHIKWKCLIDDCEWMCFPTKIINKTTGCPSCGKVERYTNKRIDDILLNDPRKIKRIGNYINIDTKLEWECHYGHRWFMIPNAILNKNRKCPKCRNKIEYYISSVLLDMNIHFKSQHILTFNDRKYYTDFYFKLENVEYIIEYNGRQHYMPIEYWGGIEKYNKQLKRDEELRNYCKTNNIVLIEIPYTIKLQNINTYLRNII